MYHRDLDYMPYLAASIERNRLDTAERGREATAPTAGRPILARVRASHAWAPPAPVGTTTVVIVIVIAYAVVASRFGLLDALWTLELAIGLWIVEAAPPAGPWTPAMADDKGAHHRSPWTATYQRSATPCAPSPTRLAVSRLEPPADLPRSVRLGRTVPR